MSNEELQHLREISAAQQPHGVIARLIAIIDEQQQLLEEMRDEFAKSEGALREAIEVVEGRSGPMEQLSRRSPLLFLRMAAAMLGLAVLSVWNPDRALEIYGEMDDAE